jgi:hypothetical protein
VTATLALLVALSGTSYAAVSMARDSVTSWHIADGTIRARDLREDSVRSAAVRDGSLRARDFRDGQLPQGAPGPQGEPGPQGQPGAAGGHVYTIGFSAAVGDCAVQASVLDTSPSEFYAEIPTGYATARRTPQGAYPNYLPGVAEGYNVRIFDGGVAVARPFVITAMC